MEPSAADAIAVDDLLRFVEVISVVIATVAALLAVRETRKQFHEQSLAERRTHESSYFGLLVRDPGLEAVRQLRVDLVDSLQNWERRIEEMEDEPVRDVLERSREFLTELQHTVVQHRDEVLVGAEVWGNEDLVRRLQGSFEAVEDAVANTTANIGLFREWSASDVRGPVVELMTIIYEGDPALLERA